jgi:manganese/zinc/iron transport system permease protein
MGAVSVTVVGAFESVGAILVVAMLVVPPATAYLFTERLGRMLALAVALGVTSALAGYGVARWLDASIAGAMAAMAGLLYKELKVTTFDPELAAALGFSPILLHYLLMSAVSVTVVSAFESVGAILVVAMLVVPPATAYLLTERLSRMLLLAVGCGIASAVGGYWLARWWDVSIAGAMATVAGALFALALLLSPSHGLLARALTHRRLGGRLADQLVLLHLGAAGRAQEPASLRRRFGWSEGRLARVTERLERLGWVERSGGGLALTAAGVGALDQTGSRPLAHPPEPA